jgi:hypothetical protein
VTQYLSYPMTGQPDYGVPLGKKVAAKLRELGYTIVAPHEIMHGGDTHFNDAFDHDDYVNADIEHGLSKCDGIALCPGWTHSKGCLAEFHWAVDHGLRIFYVESFLPGHEVASLIPMDGGKYI